MTKQCYPIHKCHFFNIFLHSDYVENNKGADVNIFNCSKDMYIIIESSIIKPSVTPGFRVCLNTLPNYKYFLETDGVLLDGSNAFVYIESSTGIRIIDRCNHNFILGDYTYYGITFEAISTKTYVGILFFNSNAQNVLRLKQFRVAPYLDMANFADDIPLWKCINGQLGFPTGQPPSCCNSVECPPIQQNFIGPQGSQGATGPIGPTGPTGPFGNPGPTGLLGPQGSPGVQGPQGFQGPQGAQGVNGLAGPVGAQGSRGIQGPIGQLGLQGVRGFQGSIGITGAAGITPVNGTWNSPWNRILNGGGSSNTAFLYQIVNQTITLFIPGISLASATNSSQPPSIIQTTVTMPLVIVPNNNQTTTIITFISGIVGLSRLDITTSGSLTISKDLNPGTVLLATDTIAFPSSDGQTGNVTIVYSLNGTISA